MSGKDDLERIVRREIYGKPHFAEKDFLDVHGRKLIMAQNQEDGLWAFYSLDGSDRWFGGPHFSIKEVVEVNEVKYVLAQHQKEGPWAVYSANGSTDQFNGEHYKVDKFYEIDRVLYLLAKNKEDTRWALYTIRGDSACFRGNFKKINNILHVDDKTLLHVTLDTELYLDALVSMDGRDHWFGGPARDIFTKDNGTNTTFNGHRIIRKQDPLSGPHEGTGWYEIDGKEITVPDTKKGVFRSIINIDGVDHFEYWNTDKRPTSMELRDQEGNLVEGPFGYPHGPQASLLKIGEEYVCSKSENDRCTVIDVKGEIIKEFCGRSRGFRELRVKDKAIGEWRLGDRKATRILSPDGDVDFYLSWLFKVDGILETSGKGYIVALSKTQDELDIDSGILFKDWDGEIKKAENSSIEGVSIKDFIRNLCQFDYDDKVIDDCQLALLVEDKINNERYTVIDPFLGKSRFGSPHFEIGELVEIEGLALLKVRNREGEGWEFYSEDGTKGFFGGPHYDLAHFLNVGSHNFLLAKKEEDSPWDIFALDGSSGVFGGPHFAIKDVLRIGKEDYLLAQHEEGGLWNVYSFEGRNDWFGSFDSVDEVVDIKGHKFLKATPEKGFLTPRLYSFNGEFGGDFAEIKGIIRIDDRDYLVGQRDDNDVEKVFSLSGDEVDLSDRGIDPSLLVAFFNIGENYYLSNHEGRVFTADGLKPIYGAYTFTPGHKGGHMKVGKEIFFMLSKGPGEGVSLVSPDGRDDWFGGPFSEVHRGYFEYQGKLLARVSPLDAPDMKCYKTIEGKLCFGGYHPADAFMGIIPFNEEHYLACHRLGPTASSEIPSLEGKEKKLLEFFSFDGVRFQGDKKLPFFINQKKEHYEEYNKITGWLNDKGGLFAIDSSVVLTLFKTKLLNKSEELFGVDYTQLLDSLKPIFKMQLDEDRYLFDYWLELTDILKELEDGKVNLKTSVDLAIKSSKNELKKSDSRDRDPSQTDLLKVLRYQLARHVKERNNPLEVLECSKRHVEGFFIKKRMNAGSIKTAFLADRIDHDYEVVLLEVDPKNKGYAHYHALYPNLSEKALLAKIIDEEFSAAKIHYKVKDPKYIAHIEHPIKGECDGEVRYFIPVRKYEKTLEEVLSQEKVDIKSCMKYLYQLSYALFNCHDVGIVHKDLKPDNIGITEYDEILLSDFGCISQFSLTAEGCRYQHPLDLMPPEMAYSSKYALTPKTAPDHEGQVMPEIDFEGSDCLEDIEIDLDMPPAQEKAEEDAQESITLASETSQSNPRKERGLSSYDFATELFRVMEDAVDEEHMSRLIKQVVERSFEDLLQDHDNTESKEKLYDSQFTPEANAWAVGCIFYRMLTGERLFKRPEVRADIGTDEWHVQNEEVYQQIRSFGEKRQGVLDEVAAINVDAARILDLCLQMEPKDRVGSLRKCMEIIEEGGYLR